jgi:hypothetical protein
MKRSSQAWHMRAVRSIAGLLLYVIFLIAGLEGAIELALRYPGAFKFLYRPAQTISYLKNYYLGFDRSIVQIRHDCAAYDEALTYRLRPGTCVVRNRESTIEYTVNSAGLRDDEDALRAPSVIVLGDSQAMGWGVPAAEAFSKRLAALTGRSVLNAAISSYETAREIALLRDLVRPSTDYVVIAYCDNDYSDNWSFVETGSLPHLNRASYEQMVAGHEQAVAYFPFKHIRRLGRLFLDSKLAKPPSPTLLTKPGFAAMNFLAILDGSVDLLRQRNVIVLEVNGYNANNPQFANALRLAASRSPLLKELASLHVIDTSTFLTDADYFLIDDHLNSGGHDKVARVLSDVVNGEGRWQVHPSSEPVNRTPSNLGGGLVETVERKGALTVIRGWAARRDDGEPAATVGLLSEGVKLVEAEPVLVRSDVAAALGQSAAAASGFALAIRTDRLTDRRDLQIVGFWADGSADPLANQQRLTGP